MILELTYEGVDASYRHIYENNYAIMSFYDSLQRRVPRPFRLAAKYLLNTDLKKAFEEKELDVEKLGRLIDDTQKWSVDVDTTTIGYVASRWITASMNELGEDPEDIELFEKINSVLEVSAPLKMSLDLWEAQNIYFSIGKNLYDPMMEKAEGDDSTAKKWLESFIRLGHDLRVKI
jgi:hypothetical protein